MDERMSLQHARQMIAPWDERLRPSDPFVRNLMFCVAALRRSPLRLKWCHRE